MYLDTGYYKSLEPFWGEWHITRQLGSGTYGTVFEIERENFGLRSVSALKVISIPASENEWNSALAEGMDEGSAIAYFRGIVDAIVKEIAVMNELKGHGNVVSYEDHAVLEHADHRGWDVLLRMELLQPFSASFPAGGNLERKQIVKLGIDICRALAYCHEHNVIHRDVKPENVFISKSGDYKLGDFGIARTMESTGSTMLLAGSPPYMAPEIVMHRPYGSSVDIYSLGIMLYRMCNRNRLPFQPPYPQPMGLSDKQTAMNRRLSGEAMPLPADAQDGLGQIILKACAFAPEDRFSSASEMQQALESLGTVQGTVNIAPGMPAPEENDATEMLFAQPLQAARPAEPESDKNDTMYLYGTRQQAIVPPAPLADTAKAAQTVTAAPVPAAEKTVSSPVQGNIAGGAPAAKGKTVSGTRKRNTVGLKLILTAVIIVLTGLLCVFWDSILPEHRLKELEKKIAEEMVDDETLSYAAEHYMSLKYHEVTELDAYYDNYVRRTGELLGVLEEQENLYVIGEMQEYEWQGLWASKPAASYEDNDYDIGRNLTASAAQFNPTEKIGYGCLSLGLTWHTYESDHLHRPYISGYYYGYYRTDGNDYGVMMCIPESEAGFSLDMSKHVIITLISSLVLLIGVWIIWPRRK